MEYLVSAINGWWQRGKDNCWADNMFTKMPADVRQLLLNCSDEEFLNYFKGATSGLRISGDLNQGRMSSLLELFDEARSLRK